MTDEIPTTLREFRNALGRQPTARELADWAMKNHRRNAAARAARPPRPPLRIPSPQPDPPTTGPRLIIQRYFGRIIHAGVKP